MSSPAVLPTTMRSLLYDTKAPGQMRLSASVPVPSPSAGQVLVRVHSAGLNPVDYKTLALPAIALWMTGMQSILGRDFSGVVVASNSAAFSVGDRVFGNSRSNSLAEYAVAEASAVALLPASVSHPDAAALPVCALTGLQALTEHGALQPGQKVLILGASGGTGSLGVQIAKCLKAGVVAGVCSAANAVFVRALGADVVADYTQGEDSIERQLSDSAPFDLTYDCVTSPEDTNYEPVSRKLLKTSGTHVAINGLDADWMRLSFSKSALLSCLMPVRQNYALFTCHESGAQLAQLAGWAAEGQLKVALDSQVAFEEAPILAAYAKIKSRRVKGKIVVNLV